MPQNRITIISTIHGKLTFDRKVCEPDVAWIIEKWLDRHPEIRQRRQDIRVVSGRWTTEDGLETQVRTVSIVAGDDLADYDPEQDGDIYEYWKAEDRYCQES
ncbi:MAG: hypothetical protein H8E44_47340 [Planctomycetes bacterium]|nr:hypothetical protein [Planctomycetota bacterium]MBL7041501.1 hypothetical protein [Pirellulaceae bacterium]